MMLHKGNGFKIGTNDWAKSEPNESGSQMEESSLSIH